MIKECRNAKDARDDTALWKIREQPANTRWNPGYKIREIDVEKDLSIQEESGEDEDS